MAQNLFSSRKWKWNGVETLLTPTRHFSLCGYLFLLFKLHQLLGTQCAGLCTNKIFKGIQTSPHALCVYIVDKKYQVGSGQSVS